jgi:hypothetical protein
MFHYVVGIYFDKNFETPLAPLSLRNIGVEESLLRVSSGLVFATVVHEARRKGALSCWELGCGVRNGAEIFGRLAAVAADNGMIVSVFDVEKAFNNLRRADMKAAVDDLDIPLLSAFVSYLFSANPTVTFADPNSEISFSLSRNPSRRPPLHPLVLSYHLLDPQALPSSFSPLHHPILC